ncbi:hypothetical protein ACU8NW_16000 [Rhizobium leguminosarum]
MGLEHALGVREHQRRRGFLEMNIKQGPKIVKRPIAGKISAVQRKMHDVTHCSIFAACKALPSAISSIPTRNQGNEDHGNAGGRRLA